jgi:hypothetical protein
MDLRAEENIRKVQPIIQNGLLSLAVKDPKVANLLIDVSAWVEGRADEVRSRLLTEARAGVDGLSQAAHVGVADLSVAVGTLDTNARKVLQGVRISSQQAGQLMRTSFTGLRGVAGSWELLLALGSLRTGAVIGAVAGFYDAGQARIASIRTSVAGDKRARDQHIAATITYGIGSGVAVYAVYSATFIGPLGWAIILTLGAYILSRKAAKSESTSLERWARRCYFGIANETPKIHWNNSTSADIAFAELNAATSGLSIDAKFEHNNTDPIVNPRAARIQNSPSTRHLKFRLSLPEFDAQTSGYQWTFIIHRCGDGPAPDYTSGEIVCSGNFHPPRDRFLHPHLRPSTPPKAPDYIKESISVRENSHHTTTTNNQKYYYMEINGTLELIPEIAKNNIEAATLSVTYWPDRAIPDAFAELTVQVQNK